MERITGFMTPRNRQATVALADEGDDHRLVNERGAITEAVAGGGHQDMVKAKRTTLRAMVQP